MLHHLLELGVRARLLRRRDGTYVARGALARCLASNPHGPLASMLEELTTYHLQVFDGLPGRLSGEPPGPYLGRYGELVARSSRIMAPWIEAFTADVLGESEGRRVLELGCGSGAYLVSYAALHSGHRGVGVDLDPGVVSAARRLVAEAGLEDRFAVRQGDLRQAESWPEGPFDVVTAHQNVYYFDAGERAALWRRCRQRLEEGGELVAVTPTSGGPMSDYFELILRSTAGCQQLPAVEELTAELRDAGFADVRSERLIPGDSVYGIAARSGAPPPPTGLIARFGAPGCQGAQLTLRSMPDELDRSD